MDLQTKNPASAATEQGPDQNIQPGNNITLSREGQHLRPGTKRAAMLLKFLEIKRQGMNCFESANLHHDYVLRSTISSLERYGIRFDRTMEQVPNAFGKQTECMRYWIAPASIEAANELLGLKEVTPCA